MTRWIGRLLLLAVLALLPCSAHALTEMKGGPVRVVTIMSGVTTNTSSAPVSLPSGEKTFYARVSGTGAVKQTVAIYGDVDTDSAGGILLCTITLSGTTTAADACPVVTANFSWYYAVTTATTGTGATGEANAMY